MRLYYSDQFELPLPEGHRFPMSKYRELRRRVVQAACHRHDTLHVPAGATVDQLGLCHSVRYVEAVFRGTLSEKEVRRIGFPWSAKLVERSRRSVGATIAASRAALSEGVAVNLAGGTHHAFADAGEGYCVFNDAAVAIRTLQEEGEINRACVVDLDVHQGNGTAAIFSGDASVFTLSVHGVKNFPLRKHPSDLDVSLPDQTADEPYLAALEQALESIKDPEAFNLVVYLAGADPYQGDRLGRLSLSKAGLADRDRAVFRWCRLHSLPVAVTMAGGYAPRIADIVDIHANTVALAGASVSIPGDRPPDRFETRIE